MSRFRACGLGVSRFGESFEAVGVGEGVCECVHVCLQCAAELVSLCLCEGPGGLLLLEVLVSDLNCCLKLLQGGLACGVLAAFGGGAADHLEVVMVRESELRRGW